MPDEAQFADWLAICNVKAAYCRLLDTKQWDRWAQLFTEDCEMDTRPSGGTLEIGRDAFVKSVRGSIEPTMVAGRAPEGIDEVRRALVAVGAL